MVGQYCCVKNCHSRSHDRSGLMASAFSPFLKWKKKNEGTQVEELTKRRRMAWIAAIRRKDLAFNTIPEYMRVCSLHFHSGEFYGVLLVQSGVKVSDKDRFARDLKRHKNQAEKTEERAVDKVDRVEESSLEEEGMVQLQVEDRAQQEVEDSRHQGEDTTQEGEDRAQQEASTVLHPDDQCEEECALCKPRCNEINRLVEENRNLKLKYYTGLPNYETFNVLLCHVIPFLPQGRRKFNPFQMILVTLMYLRLDLPLQHISHLLDVHRGTVSAAFHETLNVLHASLAPIVHWPHRDSLQVSMPHQFAETFGNHVAAIIDCFEVFIKRPSNLQARAQTFDKRITENCGFLDKLLPGDLVLADQGFDIRESVGMMYAEVKTPAFTKGRRQLDAKDVEETRSLAHLRIHVERVIGVV
uniref:THAP-type domain-containing protein n=1 Tax=Myripristis murdjan TaxID=586833 RepID=A0A667WJ66_9TELE